MNVYDLAMIILRFLFNKNVVGKNYEKYKIPLLCYIYGFTNYDY